MRAALTLLSVGVMAVTAGSGQWACVAQAHPIASRAANTVSMRGTVSQARRLEETRPSGLIHAHLNGTTGRLPTPRIERVAAESMRLAATSFARVTPFLAQ